MRSVSRAIAIGALALPLVFGGVGLATAEGWNNDSKPHEPVNVIVNNTNVNNNTLTNQQSQTANAQQNQAQAQAQATSVAIVGVGASLGAGSTGILGLLGGII